MDEATAIPIPGAPDGLGDAQAWIRTRLDELGLRPLAGIEPVRLRPWSTVLSVQTDSGVVYFKANDAGHLHEARLAQFLAERHPGLVPPPLAVDDERGWMLLADAGVQLRELVAREHAVERWLDVLPAYARLQAGLAGDVDALLALGTPDLRLAVLPARFRALLEELGRLGNPEHAAELERCRTVMPRVQALASELASFGIPETLQHDDLNDAAVYLDGEGYRVIDWGDACVTHPFFSLSVALEGVIAWGPDDVEGAVDIAPYRDAYLDAYAAALPVAPPLEALRGAGAVALGLGWICRAVNGREHGDDIAATWTRLRMALDGGGRRGL